MTLFKSILPLILSYMIENIQSLKDQQLHDRVTFFLVKIIPYYENTLEFILKHFENQPSLMDRFLTQKKEKEYDLDLIKSAYHILYFFPLEFSKKWNWAPFYKCSESKNSEICWYASRCLSILLKYDSSSKNSNQISKLYLFFFN
jgi:hypothetical protein